MTSVIRRLHSLGLNGSSFSEHKPSRWVFDAHIKGLGADFYSKLVRMHPVLNLEYGIRCNQIHDHLAATKTFKKKQLIQELTAALMMAQLLEQLHRCYLIVPREVARLRQHQAVYRSLLRKLGKYSFSRKRSKTGNVDVGLSLSQIIRDETAVKNMYRLLATRSKRLCNLFEVVVLGFKQPSTFATTFFAYLSWCIFIPRLLTNIFLLLKHTLPGPWMDKEERSLDGWIRFKAQIKRRWFELGNDVVWITVGLINYFFLVGVLAPATVYLNIMAFAFDVAWAAFRAHIELNRLYELQETYDALYTKEDSKSYKNAIKDFQKYIAKKIEFERLRLGLSVANVTAVLILMSATLVPNPILLLFTAFLLVIVWFINYALTQKLEECRPSETIVPPTKVSKLSFFATKGKEIAPSPTNKPSKEEEDQCAECYCLA